GPAVFDVETTFRERWEDSAPLTANPGRRLSSLLQREDQTPNPLRDQAPPPALQPEGGASSAVQVLRTYPRIRPVGFDFAVEGERSIALANVKALARAERLVYVEDQYLWSEEVGRHFAGALSANRTLRLAIVLPLVPDEEGVSQIVQLYGRSLALDLILEAGGDRVAVFGLVNRAGRPIYVHSKVCVIDERWASVGSDNLNRRSWSSDSEISCAVVDERSVDGAPAPDDGFPATLRRELVAEHLGVQPSEVPSDGLALFDALVAAAAALDAWFEGNGRGERPAGQLRRLGRPALTPTQRRWAAALYNTVFDPDGTIGRDESL
ncbi:MAG: phospholipase D-like domain-containing protein, partial [Nostocoides sp.]